MTPAAHTEIHFSFQLMRKMAGSGLKVLSANSSRFYFNKGSADTEPVDKNALKDAIKGDDIKRLFELLNAGLNVDHPVDSTWDHTPLILATCYGAYKVIPLLLRICHHKDTTNYEGHTALDKGIIYYSLACQHFQHKPSEIEKKYSILRALIRGGCQKVKVHDIELWIKENRRDSQFVRNLVNLLCLSPSYDLKSIGLATLVRLNIEMFHIRQILTSGAGFKYLKTILNPIKGYRFEFPEVLSDMIAEILIKATNNSFIHRQVINIKTKEARKNGKGSVLLNEHLLELLSQVDFPMTEYHRSSFPIHDTQHRCPGKPRDLKHLCRGAIRSCLRPNILFGAKYLPLPAMVKDFITLDTSAL